ncbi:MAG: trigger factor [Dehalococcoidales bacterium]|nr:trigger factor [Dehalococcoidales bacterium]
MKVTKEKIENSQAFLTIEMEPAEVEASMEKAYERVVKKANVPGFRKGKAPRPVLERHIGKDRLFENALDRLIPDAYEKALKEQEIDPFAQPQIDVTQTEPLIFKAVVPLKPSVKLGDYKNIIIEQEAAREVTDAQVDAVIDDMRHRNANWESIELRSSDYGDLLIIDLEGKIGDKPFSEQKDVPYQLKRGNPVPVPGFADQLNGTKKGETKEFTLPIPADYPEPDLVGKDAVFKVKVKDVSQEILPKLDDKFATSVDVKYKTLDELRQAIVKDLSQSIEQSTTRKFEDKVLGIVVALSEIEFPPVLVEAEVNRIINQRFPRGREEMEAYLKRINKTPEAFHEGLHTFAANQVRQSLVLGKITEEEKIEVSDAEIDTEIENTVKTIDDLQQEEARSILNTPQKRETIKNTMLTRNTLQRLAEVAKINMAAAPEKEPASVPEKEPAAAPEKQRKTGHRKDNEEEKKEEEKKP